MTLLLRSIALPALVLSVATGAAAQTAPLPLKHAPQPTTTAITAADLMTRLYIFADDSMRGREAGTLDHLRGTTYIEGELRRLGLEPAGENGTFYQDFGLEDIRARVTAGVAGQPLAQGADFLAFPPGLLPDVGAPFSATDVPVVFGGKIGSPNLVAPDAVAGKFVLFTPMDGPAGWQFFTRMGPDQYRRYRGAKGILIAALDVVPDEVREVLGGSQTRIASGDSLPSAPIGLMYVSTAAAERMMRGRLTGILPGAQGLAMSASGGFGVAPTEAPGRNVVAIVRGTDPVLRNQYVLFGAHSDHIGMHAPVEHDSLRAYNTIVQPGGAEDAGKEASPAQLDSVRTLLDSLRRLHPARPDSVSNGADDDGTGSMALLELAEYFVRNPQRRSLLFVWHTAEEKGLFGSIWYSDHPTVPRDSIVAGLNIDMIGRGDPGDLAGGGPGYIQLIGSRRLSTQLGDLVEQVNTRERLGMAFDYQYDANGHPQQYYCRSDHYSYARYGIPIVFFSTGGHRDYHMVTDEPEYIDYEKYARVTSFIGEVGKAVAGLDQRPVVDKPRPDPKAECVQ